MTSDYGYPQEELKHYTSYRTNGPIEIDGCLDEPAWEIVTKSPRFEDLEIPGRPGLFDTRAARDPAFGSLPTESRRSTAQNVNAMTASATTDTRMP